MQCVVVHQVESAASVLLPIAPVAVAAGYPSPAQDYYDGPIDLTEMLIADQAATFIVRAAGHSMIGARADHGREASDALIRDRPDPSPDVRRPTIATSGGAGRRVVTRRTGDAG